jgi:hypothetical protein
MIIKIVNKINSIKNKINILRYETYNLLKVTSGINSISRKQQLIVSLTTYPKRFNVVYLTIESLMNQTVKPDRIILWLASEELNNNKIPYRIEKLKSRGLDIRIVDENLKSYKKLIYTIQEYPSSNIVTCDDDTIYPNSFIERLYNKSLQFPNNIVAYRCSEMKKLNNHKLEAYLNWMSSQNNQPSFNLFPTGVGGILYPPNSLNTTVLNKKLFLELSPQGDDIWFKAMALLNQTKTVMVNEESVEFTLIKGSQDEALWHSNVTNNKNDEQLKNVFDYFKLYEYIK